MQMDEMGFLLPDVSAFFSILRLDCTPVLPLARLSPPPNHLPYSSSAHLACPSPPQAVILERYPDIPLAADAESVIVDMATPALRTCIAQRDDCPALMMDLLQQAAKILRSIAATRDK